MGKPELGIGVGVIGDRVMAADVPTGEVLDVQFQFVVDFGGGGTRTCADLHVKILGNMRSKHHGSCG
ncbi:hypothetical protein AU15_06430 [Marinobacter salarius]|uniref:Uncharacterized protein n=1 Tax=Marinobacter salarius TaxID=1420917 RepID=W5YVC6_9GAMM|nr:hypothetical protein AU15_06430 [Marinobacter salarius]